MGIIKNMMLSDISGAFTPNTMYGYGEVLHDVLSAKVDKDRYGKFQLTLTLANTAANRARCVYDASYFTCKDRPFGEHEQIFLPIDFKISGNKIEVICVHISNMLSNYIVYKPGTFTSSMLALDHISRYHKEPYDFGADIVWLNGSTGYIDITTPISVYSAIFNTTNSIVQNFDGYMDIDNMKLKHLQYGSAEHTFYYGRELIAEKYEVNATNYIRGFYFYKKNEGASDEYTFDYVAGRGGVRNKNITNMLCVDLTKEVEAGELLRNAANTWMQQHEAEFSTGLLLEMQLTPVLMYQTTEGKELVQNDLKIGTKIHVMDTTCGIDAEVTVNAYSYDPLKERYLSMDISNTTSKLPRLLGRLAHNSGVKVYR